MRRILFPALLSLLITSCGTETNVTQSWSSPEAPGKPLNKVMIVALMPDKERTLREQMEQQLAQNLATEGYMTTSAYAEFGPNAFKGLNEPQTLKKIRGNKIDGVMIITLLDKEQEENYKAGRVSYYPFAVNNNNFWKSYTTYLKRVQAPAYYTTTTKYFIQTNLYDVKTNKLLYSAQSETFDPASAQNLAADYSKAVVKNMKEKNLLMKNQVSK